MQTLEKESITIYTDPEHEERMRNQIAALKSSVQAEVDKFKEMDLGDLKSDELFYFASSPHYFIQDRWGKKQEAPTGWDRANYLKLLTKPNDSHFIPQYFPIHTVLTLEGWEVKINEEVANSLIYSQTYSIEKDSKQHNIFKALQSLEKSINKLHEAYGMNVLHTSNSELSKFFQEPDLRFSHLAEVKLDSKRVKNELQREV